jgi:hypothetical protein
MLATLTQDAIHGFPWTLTICQFPDIFYCFAASFEGHSLDRHATLVLGTGNC